MARSPRFQEGDVIHVVKYYDVGDEVVEEGIVLILGYVPHYEHTVNGIYQIKPLKGNIGFIRFNSDQFDKLEYLVWLGNINENESLRLLYAPRVNKVD